MVQEKTFTRAQAERLASSTNDEETLTTLLQHKNQHVRYKAMRALGFTNVSPSTARNVFRSLGWLLHMPALYAAYEKAEAAVRDYKGDDSAALVQLRAESCAAFLVATRSPWRL